MNFDNSYARLPDTFFTKVNPTPVSKPKLVLWNTKLARELGISEKSADVYAGNLIVQGSEPLAQAYAGHQFGNFNKLGDGRAILLGEHITPKNHRYDIQLKGSGATPYSRRGDGRATLTSMLREYIVSEAMQGLGVPTTRSLAITITGETITREEEQQGGILTRIAASHIRVGTFQYAAAFIGVEGVKALTDYTIARHYAGLTPLEFLKAVIDRQAKLIAKWLSIGFIHGVMNTDNMTISGETIDYGPCAFLENYDPNIHFSFIDKDGRYAYGNQPKIGLWNLTRFAETLLPLIDENEDEALKLAENALSLYGEIFQKEWLSLMRAKLGLANEEEGDALLIQGFLDFLQKEKRDYTNSFRELWAIKSDDSWFTLYNERLKRNSLTKAQAKKLMDKSNPYLIARNYQVELALKEASEGDYGHLNRMVAALQNPFKTDKEFEDLTLPSPFGSEGYQTFCGT